MNINISTPLNETTGSDILAGCLFPYIDSPPRVSDWRILALNKSHRLEVMGNPSSGFVFCTLVPAYPSMPPCPTEVRGQPYQLHLSGQPD